MSSAALQTFSGSTAPFKLFDSNSVWLATLIGGPVAGGFLIALNYHRLGMMGKAVVALAIGVIVTGLAVLIGWNLPSSVNFPLALALLFATHRLAGFLQGRAIQEHVEHGGSLASRWTAFASGLGFMAVLLTVAFLTVYKSGGAFAASKSVTIGTRDQVYYSGSATRQDAQTLGNALKKDSFFTDQGADVRETAYRRCRIHIQRSPPFDIQFERASRRIQHMPAFGTITAANTARDVQTAIKVYW